MMLSIDGSRLMATKYLLMAGSFADGECENHQFKALGLAAHFCRHGSVHRRAGAVVGGPGHAVALIAQLTEQVHHRCLGRIHEGPARDVLGVEQQLFGFGQFFHAASLPRLGFSGIPFHLSRVEAT